MHRHAPFGAAIARCRVQLSSFASLFGPVRSGRRIPRTPGVAARLLAVLTTTLLVACGGDGTKTVAPTPTDTSSITLQLSTTSVSPASLGETLDTLPRVQCQVDVVAQITGTGTGTWIDGEFRFYDLRDTTRVLGTFDLQGSDVIGAWGSGTIGGGQGQTSSWLFSGGAPFAAQFDMRYQSGTSTTPKVSTVSFRCTPPIAPGAAKPTLGAVTVSPASGTLEAGTPLRVDFSANTPAGALMTAVRVTGPCVIERRFVESFQPTAAHSVSIPLPYPCRLGAPIGVSVLVVDAFSDASTAYSAYPVALADTTRPWMNPWFLQKSAGGQFGEVPSGDYTPSDSIRVQAYVHDNYKIKVLFWEVLPAGLRDSIVFPDSALRDLATDNYWPLMIPVDSSWIGKPIQLRFQGRDSQGNLSAFLTTPLDSIRVRASATGP